MSSSFLRIIIFMFVIVAFHACKQQEVQSSLSDTPAQDSTETKQAVVSPGFVHAVYFWLKDDNPEMVDDFIQNGLPALAKIPSIQSVSWGPPAGTDRAVVDNSYDLAWIVNFETAADQDAYQVDPLHVEFVDKYKAIFEKIQVYDNIVEHHYSAK